MKFTSLIILIVGGLALTLVSVPSIHYLRYQSGKLIEAAPGYGTVLPTRINADFDEDGNEDILNLKDGVVEITSSGQLLYRSAQSWTVTKAEFADLNRDGKTEAALLVWRDFAPWPIDRLLPAGGRIDSHQNAGGKSCHLILIGWKDGKPGEAWAGSALAQPVIDFAAADLDGDDRQELITIDGRYTNPASFPGKAVRIWEWNGFGFSRLEQIDLVSRRIYVTDNGDGEKGILVSNQ